MQAILLCQLNICRCRIEERLVYPPGPKISYVNILVVSEVQRILLILFQTVSEFIEGFADGEDLHDGIYGQNEQNAAGPNRARYIPNCCLYIGDLEKVKEVRSY